MLWIALKFFVLLQSKQRIDLGIIWSGCCELLSNFLYFCSRNNRKGERENSTWVVNCSQIFCTFAVETTESKFLMVYILLWIALKFFVLLQSKQRTSKNQVEHHSCELLSNFLYFCSRNNTQRFEHAPPDVVNCSQIFCTFAVETTQSLSKCWTYPLWIALKFFVLLQSKQPKIHYIGYTSRCELLSNFLYFCSRNNTIRLHLRPSGCELLSNFLYFCSRNNTELKEYFANSVVNCSQIFCTFAVETTLTLWRRAEQRLWIALKFFVLLQSKQPKRNETKKCTVVNCSQIFCTFAVETTNTVFFYNLFKLWIALKFFVLLQSKQLLSVSIFAWLVVNCSQIFCTFAVETTLFAKRLRAE